MRARKPHSASVRPIAGLVDWIERDFGVEPDAGSGALEWGMVAIFAVVTLVLAALARREWRRPARLRA